MWFEQDGVTYNTAGFPNYLLQENFGKMIIINSPKEIVN